MEIYSENENQIETIHTSQAHSDFEKHLIV